MKKLMEFVFLLIFLVTASGIAFTEDDIRVILRAAGSGDIDKVKELIKVNPKLANATSKEGFSPLISAVHGNKLEVVKFLISNGADVNIVDPNGDTPLLAAIKWKHPEIAEILLEKGADVNVREKFYRYTPLHIALESGFDDLAKKLIAKGADLNAQDYSGDSPLHVAVSEKKLEMVKLIVSKGANVNIQNKNKRTPLRYATESWSDEIADFLRKSGGIDAEWRDVLFLQGSSNQKTEIFRISSDKWRIVWQTNTAGKPGTLVFLIEVHKPDGSLVKKISPFPSAIQTHFTVQTTDGKPIYSSGAIQPSGGGGPEAMEKAGKYYLSITAAQPYTVRIEEQRLDTK